MAEESERRTGWWSAPVSGAADRRGGTANGADAGAGGSIGAGAAGAHAGPELPSITLPKGGGAIRGLDEKLSVNQATGTATMSVGVYTSPARAAFGPSLGLGYDSGSGNGPFGLGWSLPLGAVTRKTSTGLPRYDDAADSDIFLLNGDELVPRLDDGVARDQERARDGRRYAVRAYRPRVESAFARIERWTEHESGATHWRVISRENVTSLYGSRAQSRVADPADPNRVFTWLVDHAFDDRGNAMAYGYKPEDDSGFEHNADAAGRAVGANRYLKRIHYGNRTPYPRAGELPADWCFELVLDYGEHDLAAPTPAQDGPWDCRPDPFSSYRSRFEIRTLRRCRRLLMFHSFAELGPDPVLVRSTDLSYHEPPDDPALPAYSLLSKVTQTGWIGDGAGGYQTASLPPTRFDYAPLTIDQTQHLADPHTLENVTGARERFIDVDGEGLRGLLVEDEKAWYFKRNVSAWDPAGGGPRARFEPLAALVDKPAGGGYTLTDLNGEGRLCAVRMAPPDAGWYEYDADAGWSAFRELSTAANIDWSSSELRLADVDGDGLADVLVSEDDAFVWNAWIRGSGFASARRAAKPHDEEHGPRVMLADREGSVFLADMSGDGLADLVRIRNGEVCYWPSLGFGEFGAKVVMRDAPLFDLEDTFDARRVRLADIDGSGTADLVYLGVRATVWFNRSGASWTAGTRLEQAPRIDNDVEAEVLDLLGTGTACLVWTSPLPDDAGRVLRYIDLTASAKPYLLSKVRNGFGGERTIGYAPSTKFAVADRAAGAPWLTRLPIPVHVVERLRTQDRIAGTSLTSRYSYHHGFYDPIEREFRGFGRVDSYDTDEVPAASGTGEFTSTPTVERGEFVLPPVLTRTWLHTGAVVDGKEMAAALRREYYGGDPQAPTAHPTRLPQGTEGDEVRQAYRALRGMVLREEIYSLDGTPEAVHPHVVHERSYRVDRLQRPTASSFGGYRTWQREAVSCNYERQPTDPRIAHSLNLAVDAWGNLTRRASVSYPRRARHRQFPEQGVVSIVYGEADFARPIDLPDTLRVGLICERREYELTGVPLADGALYEPDALARAAKHAAVLPYEARPTGPGAARRLLAGSRTIYRSDDLAEVLPRGIAGSRAVIDRGYSLRYTPGLLREVFGDRLAAGAPQESALVDLDGDGCLWAPSGTAFFSPDPRNPDLEYATRHFFLPRRLADPWGSLAEVAYDAYDLLPISTRDPVGNTTLAANNYRVLHAWLMTDANGNRSGARFDALGMVIASATLGKPLSGGADEGDHLDPSTPEPSPSDDPTIVYEYDLDAYTSWEADPARNEAEPAPVWARKRSRVWHRSPDTEWLTAYAYTDGFGRVAMTKQQAEPGEAPRRRGDGAFEFIPCEERWVGSGLVVYDNKGNKIKVYEPFFASTPGFEHEDELKQWGVTAITRYDPLGRAYRVDLPDGTIRRVEFGPWRTVSWDEGDTVLESAWYAARIAGGRGKREREAARRSAGYADTPATADLDALGRPFRTTADNGEAGSYTTVSTLDIQGRPLVITDALGRVAMRRVFDLAGSEIRTESIDNGERWLLLDAAGRPLRTWDGRGHTMRMRYDALRRPTDVLVADAAAADPTAERLAETVVYGESAPDARERNLRGVAIAHYDEAGAITTDVRDFDGNILATTRRILAAPTGDVDWSQDPELGDERFTTTTRFDALGRAVAATTPDGSVTANTFNARSLLTVVHVTIPGAQRVTVVESAQYDAKRRRVRIVHGNGATTTCEFDPESFRLVRLLTMRAEKPRALQDVRYSYDAVGNVTHVADEAQQTAFFRNQVVPPGGDYIYDPVYRLVSAAGREHVGQTDAGLGLRTPKISPADGRAMRTYRERYDYDASGNLVRVRHRAAGGDWTRRYRYGDGDVPDGNNRLAETTAADIVEPYAYDAHGNLIALPQLARLAWDWKDQLRTTVARRVDDGTAEATHYRYDSARARVEKLSADSAGRVVRRRLYLGTCEIYREYDVNGTVTKERRTLHVGDGAKRVCLIESTLDDKSRHDDTALKDTVLRYQFGDLLSSVALELDDRARVITYEEYHPYGTTSFSAGRSRAEASLKRYRYSGKERDDESGFYYYGARYYVPWLARWTQPDPAGLVDGLNLYAFAHDNPVSWRDGDGTDCDPSNATCLDPNDPRNYASLQDFRQGVRGPYSEEGIVAMWDDAHPHSASSTPTVGSDVQASATATADQPDGSGGAGGAGGDTGTAGAPTTATTEQPDPYEQPVKVSGWKRYGIGALQVVGGGLEIVAGIGGGALTCLETLGGGCVVGGLAVGHGVDTLTSGIGTAWNGEVSRTYTARAATWTAKTAGAGPAAAHWTGTGFDMVAGMGLSVGTGAIRQSLIEGSTESATSLTLGFLPRTVPPGHNIIGITTEEGATQFWHLATPKGGVAFWKVFDRNAAEEGFVLSRIGVSPAAADEALNMAQSLKSTYPGGATGQVWGYLGPNCTTSTTQVLKAAGVSVPAYSRTPVLLYLGVNYGYSPVSAVVTPAAGVTAGAATSPGGK